MAEGRGKEFFENLFGKGRDIIEGIRDNEPIITTETDINIPDDTQQSINKILLSVVAIVLGSIIVKKFI